MSGVRCEFEEAESELREFEDDSSILVKKKTNNVGVEAVMVCHPKLWNTSVVWWSLDYRLCSSIKSKQMSNPTPSRTVACFRKIKNYNN